MGVAFEHLHRLVAGYGGDAHDVHPPFGKAAGRLVAQVVEVQVLDAGPPDQPSPDVLEAVGRFPLVEHPLAVVSAPGKRSEGIDRRQGQGNSPGPSVLRFLQGRSPACRSRHQTTGSTASPPAAWRFPGPG